MQSRIRHPYKVRPHQNLPQYFNIPPAVHTLADWDCTKLYSW